MFWPAAGFSQDRWVIPKLTGKIVFDGMPFEKAWEEVTPFPMYMQKPVFGNKPSEETEIRVAYDDHYIYISGRLYDRNSSLIQTTTKKRDEYSPSSDGMGILFDNFLDRQNALAFMITPAGNRTDFTIFNDGVGSMRHMPFNMSWNTFWDVKTKITGEGWFAEIRIPVSSLRFQIIDGKTRMGITVWRRIPHNNETDCSPEIDPKYGEFALMKPSLSREVVFDDLQPARPLYIAPYALGGITQNHILNDEGTAYIHENDPKITGGLDIKYGFSEKLTMDLTINPDFAQVEADDQKVNLTRFSLFFPEKRLFFQERASLFSFSLGGPNNLFYSRRIGIDRGNPVNIYGGLRLVGRLGQWDMGLLDMQTVNNENLPSENFGVFRMKRQVINPNSFMGGMFTSRLGTNGNYNIAYGLDGVIRMFGEDYMSVKIAQSFIKDSMNNPLSLAPTRLRFQWERRSIKGPGYRLSYSYAGKSYNPGIGFEMKEQFSMIYGQLFYGWLPGENSKLFSHKIALRSMNFFRLDGSPETLQENLEWGFQSKSSLSGNFALQYYYESLREPFYLSEEAFVPVGTYRFFSSQIRFSTPQNRLFYVMNMINAGEFYDGSRVSWTVMPTWNASASLNVGGSYQINRVWFPERNQNYISQLVGVKVLLMFNTKLSLNAFIQYNSFTSALLGNIRFRYNPREGNDLYIVYNDDLNTNLGREIPTLPLSNTRTFVVKYTYTFNIPVAMKKVER